MDLAAGAVGTLDPMPTAIQVLVHWTGGLETGIVLLVLFCAGAAVPLLALVRWWSEGVITGAVFAALASLYALAMAVVLGPSPMAVKCGMMALVVGAAVGLPILNRQLLRIDNRMLVSEMEAAYRRAIEASPSNAAAYARLADLMYREGRVGEAIATMRRAVQLSPQTMEREKLRLDGWLEDLQKQRRPIEFCPRCRAENMAGNRRCEACGGPMVRTEARQLGAATALSAGIAVAAVLAGGMLPFPLNALVMVGGVAAGVAVAWRQPTG